MTYSPTITSPVEPHVIVSPYRVECPSGEKKDEQAIVPFQGLSPVSSVVAGLRGVSLKRNVCAEEQAGDTKRRRCLKFDDQSSYAKESPEQGLGANSDRLTRNSCRAIKQRLRGQRRNIVPVVITDVTVSTESESLSRRVASSSDNVMVHFASSMVDQNAGGWVDPATGAQ